MAQLWLPGAVRRPQPNGGTMIGGPPRATWHITWDSLGPGGSLPRFSSVANYLVNVGFCPHLMWDPWAGHIEQYYPASQGAKALRDPAGGVRTNRMGAVNIQVETWFSPGCVVDGRTYRTVADTPAVGLDRIVAWMRSWGVPDVWPDGMPQWSGNPRGTTVWTSRGGHYGHCNVPENTHDDPGPMPRTMFTKEDEVTPQDKTDIINGVIAGLLTSDLGHPGGGDTVGVQLQTGIVDAVVHKLLTTDLGHAGGGDSVGVQLQTGIAQSAATQVLAALEPRLAAIDATLVALQTDGTPTR